MTVAICIPTFNQARFLRPAVESALAQRDCAVDVWVADDASTDATPAVMAAFAADPRVKYHRQPRNLGVAANAGWLMGQVQTEFLVRLDSDDLLAPDFCSTLSAMLRANSGAGIAHAAVQEIDEAGHHRRIRLLRRASGVQPADTALREAVTGYRVAANICMFRRSALPTAPCFRPGTDFVEDWDLFVRLAARGVDNVYSERILASYRVANSPGPFRAARKLMELEGTRRIFDESVLPAFCARGWDTLPLTQARRRLACGQARVLRHLSRAGVEYGQIRKALEQLGDCPGLRWRLRLVSLGLAPLLDVAAAAEIQCRDRVKRILRSGRRNPRLT
jgi:glycosyltransferase involved in cell wall biosynthesis